MPISFVFNFLSRLGWGIKEAALIDMNEVSSGLLNLPKVTKTETIVGVSMQWPAVCQDDSKQGNHEPITDLCQNSFSFRGTYQDKIRRDERSTTVRDELLAVLCVDNAQLGKVRIPSILNGSSANNARLPMARLQGSQSYQESRRENFPKRHGL
jgi:hypothetical protein